MMNYTPAEREAIAQAVSGLLPYWSDEEVPLTPDEEEVVDRIFL